MKLKLISVLIFKDTYIKQKMFTIETGLLYNMSRGQTQLNETVQWNTMEYLNNINKIAAV